MKTLCGLDCRECGLRNECGGCTETNGHPFDGSCMIAVCCEDKGCENCGKAFEATCKLKKQLIVLETFEDNQRTKRAVLTAKGSELAEKLAVRMHQVEKKAWENLEKEEQELLTRLTRKYADALGETLQEMKG